MRLDAYAAEICGTLGKRREMTVVIAKNANDTHKTRRQTGHLKYQARQNGTD